MHIIPNGILPLVNINVKILFKSSMFICLIIISSKKIELLLYKSKGKNPVPKTVPTFINYKFKIIINLIIIFVN